MLPVLAWPALVNPMMLVFIMKSWMSKHMVIRILITMSENMFSLHERFNMYVFGYSTAVFAGYTMKMKGFLQLYNCLYYKSIVCPCALYQNGGRILIIIFF